MIVFNEDPLRRHLRANVFYYQRSIADLPLDKDALEPRTVQTPSDGKIVAIPEVGGLHHRYERRAA